MGSSLDQSITYHASTPENPREKVILRRYTQYFEANSPSSSRRKIVLVADEAGNRTATDGLLDGEAANDLDLSSDSSDWMDERQNDNDADETINPQFGSSVQLAIKALDAGVYPQLIPTGSSGSYYVRSKDNVILAVFKPRDEEPFAPLNPKWGKFIQRIFCCCCFGRGALIPNTGYLAETGASIIDERLKLNIVPTTRVQKLISPTFNYGHGCCGRKIEPYPKEGSYQIYMNGYRHAHDVLNEWSIMGLNKALSLTEQDAFTVEFQKMCLLDYLIRNTDRHMDNWLIRHVPGSELRIAAIDNGLSFPTRHPEKDSVFRSYSYDWAALHWAHKPWDHALRSRLLKLMTPCFLHDLCKELKTLFLRDRMIQNRIINREQIRVLRGQAWNLRLSLLNNETPFQLVARKSILVRRRYHGLPPSTSWEECFRPTPEGPCCHSICSIM